MPIRKDDEGNPIPSISRQNCIDRGCIEWRTLVDRDLCSILHPEEGALAKIHEKFDNKIDSQKWKFIGIMSMVISGLFTFSVWINNETKGNFHESVAQIRTQIDTLNKNVGEVHDYVVLKSGGKVMRRGGE